MSTWQVWCQVQVLTP